MKPAGKIFLGALALITIGGAAAYAYNSYKNAGATPADFTNFVDAANRAGSDMFENATQAYLNKMRDSMVKNLTRSEAKELTAIVSKSESGWSAATTARFTQLIFKWTGKRL